MKSATWFKVLLPVTLFALLMLFGRTPATALAANAPASGSTIQIVKETVNWTLPADTCSTLPSGVTFSGTGTRFAVLTTQPKPNGKTVVINSDFVQGTASDSNGGTYHFLYANQDEHQVSESGKHIGVHMTDIFTLSGNGGTNNYTVAFKWSWTYNPPEQEWPPVHNWVKTYTLGDPLTCDPL